MEQHRLIPMKEGYDRKLFQDLWEETKKLRKTLAYEIDHRRFGVSKDEIEAWFEDKFIFAFNKYFDQKEPSMLKAYIIIALKFFKCRILRKVYEVESETNIYSNIIRLDDMDLFNIIPDVTENTEKEVLMGLALSFMKKHLSPEAFLVLDIQLNPPLYIMGRIKSNTKLIPAQLIAEFIGLPNTNASIKFVKRLREEITIQTIKAKNHFNSSLAFTAI
jgi:hypothetical protein